MSRSTYLWGMALISFGAGIALSLTGELTSGSIYSAVGLLILSKKADQ